MPLHPEHIKKYLNDESEPKNKSELLGFLTQRIDELCFEECQIDRIACTLQPKCSRRFLLKLRIKNNLTLEDLPKFCYSVQKGVIEREFRNKTVVYRPFDAYLFLVDFLDVFFHGDYRKLNKFITFKNWKDAIEIFDDRIKNRNENFDYLLTDNYLIFKFEDRIHIIFIKEKYVLCNASRENIPNLELLFGICKLYARLYFPEIKLNLIPSKYLEIAVKVPFDVLRKVTNEPSIEKDSKADDYFWNIFWEDLNALTQYCEELHLQIDINQDLEIILNVSTRTKNYIEKGKWVPLRFRDLRLILNFITRIYQDYYIIWIE
ncbi:MAG: hypothetical protein ACFE75_05850 [Candidatus Hodarchaeota archaeon]